MINLKIVRREFLRTVLRRGFIIKTLGMPFFIVAYFGFLKGLVYVVSWSFDEKKEAPCALVDYSPLTQALFRDKAEGDSYTFHSKKKWEGDSRHKTLEVKFYRELDAAKGALLQGKLSGIGVIPRDFMSTGRLEVYILKSGELRESFKHSLFKELVKERLLDYSGLSAELRARLQEDPELEVRRLDAKGDLEKEAKDEKGKILQELLQKGSKYLLAAVMIMVILLGSHYFQASVQAEKQSKLMELLLSSVGADELVLGKTIGIAAALLVQMAVWLAMVFSLPLLVALRSGYTLDLGWSYARFGMSAAFSVLGILFYGLLITSAGSHSSDPAQSAGSAKAIKMAVAFIGYAVFLCLIRGGDTLWRVCSVIPLFTPILLPIQLCNPKYSIFEAGCFLALMILYVALLGKFAGRILRMSVMLEGQEIGLVRWVRMLFSREMRA
jgi:ABC-2 type transport system permease protein